MKKLLMSCAAASALIVAMPVASAADKMEMSGGAKVEMKNEAAVKYSGSYMLSANELIGQDVVDAKGEDIATVDDILVTQDDRTVVAILSVGGFLGIGDKLVAVPYDKLQIGAKGVTLAGISKQQLETMSSFEYRGGSDSLTRQRYMTRMERTMDSWSARAENAYDTTKEKTAQGADKLGQEFDAAWEKTKHEFRELKRATGEEWEDAKVAFERAMDDLENRWDRATN